MLWIKNILKKGSNDIQISYRQCPTIQFVLFTQTLNQDNIMTQTAMHMLALSEIIAPEKMKLALSEWFHLMNYEKWCVKYPVKIQEKHFNTLKEQCKWFGDNNLEGTPTTFLNTKKLSYKIDFSDLQYIIE
jgi:hypothetical protein